MRLWLPLLGLLASLSLTLACPVEPPKAKDLLPEADAGADDAGALES